MRITRREFFKGLGVAAGSFALPGASYDLLVPFLEQPDDVIPGVSTWFATSCRECPAGCGMVVRNVDSHIVKSEGNPIHPINRGTLCARGQAAAQGLYDPDRIKNPQKRSESGKLKDTTWNAALKAIGPILSARPRIAMITDLQAGSLQALMKAWLGALGSNRLIIYEPVNYEAVKSTHGGIVPSFNIAASDFLISFACDFLETWVSPVEYAVEFAKMRQVTNGRRGRFVYVGARISMTAANADYRIIVPPGICGQVAAALTSGGNGAALARYGVDPKMIAQISKEMVAAKAVLAMPGWDADSAAAAASINAGRGAGLVNTARPHAVSQIASTADMTALIADMAAGNIDVLIVHNANPVFGLPKFAGFDAALKRIKTIISLSSYPDETTIRAHWVLPSHTPLETWGDYRPYPDVLNIVQPAMGNLYDTKMVGDTLISLAQSAGLNPAGAFGAANYYNYIRAQWKLPAGGTQDRVWDSLAQRGGRFTAAATGSATPNTGYDDLEEAWGASVSAAALPAAAPPPSAAAVAATGAGPSTPALPKSSEVSLWAYPDIYLYDGRGANRRWLQEMPDPITRAAWTSWAEIHPDTAKQLGVNTDDLIEIRSREASVSIPVFVWEGVSPGTVAVPIGQGHNHYGRYAEGMGENILHISGVGSGVVRLSRADDSQWITRIKGSNQQHGRNIARTAPLAPVFQQEEPVIMPLPEGYTSRDMYPGHEHYEHRWAMTVDLDKCIGCNACVTACYAENNLAVVGPEGIWRRREMSWIRIDQYVDMAQHSAPILFQPMLCQHCDAAPCEPVCPVYAASHSEDGLNMQVYNRCVGTRYCSNNCPYKVRRFNWFGYEWPEPLNWQLNPDVTVRCRGVMEKCTFCIQRIRQAGIVAKHENRPIRDGEITPACAQTCPTGVFTFGDLMDKNSRVSKIIRADPRAYQVLRHLNTKPAVIYLKKVVG